MLTPISAAGTHGGAILVLSLVIALGLLLGGIRIFGISLGVAGVLFSGLAFGHFGLRPDLHLLDFIRELGLILFVYTIGLQIGPAFSSSFRRDGLPLNLMAATIVLLAAAICFALHYFGGIDAAAVVGIFSGATTNTPSLGSAGEAMRSAGITDLEILKRPGLAYAVVYPFGIMGIIFTMLLIRRVFRVNTAIEAGEFAASRRSPKESLRPQNFVVRNPALDGQKIGNLEAIRATGAVISRILHAGVVSIADRDTTLHADDIVVAVGNERTLKHFSEVVGPESDVDVRQMVGAVTTRRLVVTHRGVVGQTIEDLDLVDRFGIIVTRIRRADTEFAVRPSVRLQFGDSIVVVGEAADIDRAAIEVGDSAKALNQPQIASVFCGIALGALLGMASVPVPGLPAGLKLGLAGGPLVVAILFSQLGRVGPFVPYIPHSANLMMREFGIALFLACVGLKSGDQFVAVLVGGDGLRWMLCGAVVTSVPLLTVALAARSLWKLNFASLCGLLAGASTSPPALAFADNINGSDAPSISYATVYPLTMILRIVVAQVLVLFLL